MSPTKKFSALPLHRLKIAQILLSEKNKFDITIILTTSSIAINRTIFGWLKRASISSSRVCDMRWPFCRLNVLTAAASPVSWKKSKLELIFNWNFKIIPCACLWIPFRTPKKLNNKMMELIKNLKKWPLRPKCPTILDAIRNETKRCIDYRVPFFSDRIWQNFLEMVTKKIWSERHGSHASKKRKGDRREREKAK